MRVLHLLHTTHVGGVEAAAAHLRDRLGPDAPTGSRGAAGVEDVRYRAAALAAAPAAEAALEADLAGTGVNSPRSVLRILRVLRTSAPELLVTSLWRSLAVGALARVAGYCGAWAVWVHNSEFTNPVDRLVHRWTLPRADLVLCDSIAARDAVVRPLLARAGSRVPVLLVRPDAAPIARPSTPPPPADRPRRLISWGRIAPQKRLDEAVRVVAELDRRRPGGAHLTLVGPDAGALEDLRAVIAREGAGHAVTFHGPADRTRLAALAAEADAFVQTSAFEGYAMAAHEALAAGMPCVLAPVGDLAVDTADGHDAIHHRAGDAAGSAARLLALAADPAAWAEMSRRARAVRTGSMVEEFVAACRTAVPAAPGAAA